MEEEWKAFKLYQPICKTLYDIDIVSEEVCFLSFRVTCGEPIATLSSQCRCVKGEVLPSLSCELSCIDRNPFLLIEASMPRGGIFRCREEESSWFGVIRNPRRVMCGHCRSVGCFQDTAGQSGAVWTLQTSWVLESNLKEELTT